MGDTLLYLIDHDTLNTKFVMWAHNYHVGVTSGQPNSQSAGYYLRQRLGSAYYAVSLQLDHGSFTTRVLPPPGEFKIGTHLPSNDVSLSWYLSRVGADQLFLDIRAVPRGSQVEQWLETPQVVRGASWAYSDPLKNASRQNVYERYDGILFVAESTPTHPTANARDIVARKIGF
jgi:erythromycin esterase-like protein